MKKALNALFVFPTIVLFGLFFIVPMVLLFLRSIQSADGLTLANYTEIITNPYYFRALKNSVILSLCVTLISLLVGGILAFFLARGKFRFKALLMSVLSFPVSLPGVVVAFMIIILFGTTGVIPMLTLRLFHYKMGSIAYTVYGILFAYLYFIVPRTAMTLHGSLLDLDTRLEEAARTIGANEYQTICHVILPILVPSFVSAGILAFSTATSAFGTAFTLANQFDIIPIVMYNEYTMSFRIGKASAMAMTIGLMCFLLNLVYRRIMEREDRNGR